MVSCSTTRYVGEGEYLLDRVRIQADNADVKPADLKPYLQQHPNYKVFGMFKWPLYIYGWSGGKDKGWLSRMGESPVKLDVEMAELSREQLRQHLANRGYANAVVEMSIDTVRRHKKATLEYSITANRPYRIVKYEVEVDDPCLDSLIRYRPPKRSLPFSLFSAKVDTSYIRDSMLFDRNLLDKERQRITTVLRRNGYYAFNRDYIGFLADSAFTDYGVEVKLFVKPFVRNTSEDNGASFLPAMDSLKAEDINLKADDVNANLHRRYYINNVRILTDYDPLDYNQISKSYPVMDDARGTNIFYRKTPRSIRPSVLRQSCYILPGTLFNERSVEQTYTSFAALKALRYISIKFDEVEGDTMRLDCTVRTAPARPLGIRYEVEGTNSAGDLGFATSMTYQHRNLFRGSELFSAGVRGGYEYLSSTQEHGNYWEFAGETSLVFPHFLFPFVGYETRRKIHATTEFNLSYDQQRRPEYHRSIVAGRWIYHWQDRQNILVRHTFKLMDLNYVFLPYIDHNFKAQLPETTALYNYSDQFVVSAGYIYSFNNYDYMERRRNTTSLRIAFESAGNLMYGLSNLFRAAQDANGRYKLFGINYSEFLKGDVDFARNLTIDDRNSMAIHFGGGLAYPIGNSTEIPFERRYYAGGANSNRGWSVRSLGPGRMNITDSTSFVQQTGDVRLDANIEYRSRLFWNVELALFVDAGNIWTIHEYDYQPEGSFSLSRFYGEIAVSYGMGVRLDFDYFLLRLDAGLKAYNPQACGRSRLALAHPNLHDNFAWHFAVGYPF
jgi:outer membrane protein assembly factor BamA